MGVVGVMHIFELQDSPQTLAEAISEYYVANPELATGRNISPEAQHFFRCHDVAHVVFGCSTALDDEATVKIASIFGTTAGLRVLKGYRLHESRQIYKQISLSAALRSIAYSVVVVPRTLLRCLRQRSRWPWVEFEQYLGVPLRDIRQRFGIVVPHGNQPNDA
jgi:ubiquinone biosynthesis protein Coq4